MRGYHARSRIHAEVNRADLPNIMKLQFNILTVFLFVTLGALIGMILGGAFGYAAGMIGPDLFKHLLPWEEFEPVGVATVIGASGGVVCGGALAAFAILIQFILTIVSKRRDSRSG